MKVSKLMSRKLITVTPDDSVERAVQLLRQRGVRHLLVLKDGRLVGIISDRDLKRALDPAKARKRKTSEPRRDFFPAGTLRGSRNHDARRHQH